MICLGCNGLLWAWQPTPRQGPRLTLGSGLGNLTTNTHTNQTVENDQTEAIPIVGKIAGAEKNIAPAALLLG